MKIIGNKPSLFWIWLILSFACSHTPSEPIEFSISQGVLNNMDFASLGIQTGQQLPDILFYNLSGEKFTITRHAPKLLISGSYTCDITRSKLQAIDSLYEKYKDKVDIYLVNTLEAHPQNSSSPYSLDEEPWLAKDNIMSGISAEQPTTIEGRVDLAEKWIKETGIQTPIILDGPKNGFWNQVGQAPNMAILVSTDGEVLLKQPWFDKDEMEDAIDNQLQHLKAD
ncbi:hypothetical protein [Algoriphagus resistens]|uniref:hypothetical protein n=1 Tax=Algoriphagus resistens TaxID=1750590 RepID=UPI00071681EF|nr:hypothetical protein [Algoriphagus resistens]